MSDGQSEMQSRVSTPHTASYPEAISFSKGDTITLGKRDPDNPGWVWCTGDDGTSGWVPEAFLILEGSSGIALRDYDALELTVNVGDMVTVIETVSGWSLCDTPHGRRGWVPESCLTATDTN